MKRHRDNLVFVWAVTAMMAAAHMAAAAGESSWDYQPCRIQAAIALDFPGTLSDVLGESLPDYLESRAGTSIGPAWQLDVQIATGPLRHTMLTRLAALSGDPPGEFPTGGDKLVLMTVASRPDGYELSCREYDRYVQRWSATLHRQWRQLDALPEQLFALAWETVAPLAHYDIDPNDEHRVTLMFRGAALPLKSADAKPTARGAVYLPLVRRTTPQGDLRKDGILTIPWTFLQTDAAADDSGPTIAQIHSGIRRPIGARRGGRIEQVAIALRADPGDTTLRFRSRTASAKPLSGYAVFAKNTGEEATTLIGRSDRDGDVEVPPGETPVQMLFVKNGSALLARLPIVPGAEPQIDVPLPDDEVRFETEVRLSALREDLIDVVARRNILLARARQKIDDKDYPGAQKLLKALDELPSRLEFTQQVDREARLHHSDDPQIQKRIDQLVAQTKAVLGQFLDNRGVNELHDRLRESQKSPESGQTGGGAGKSSDT